MSGSPSIANELARRLDAPVVTIGQPQPVLNTGWQQELQAAGPALQAIAARYEHLLSAGKMPVTALSRCAVAIATLPVLARFHPDAAIVWLDAHADLNTPDSSTSGYLGGLALSGPLGLWDSGFGQGVAGSNVILVGARDIDPAEQHLIDQGIVTLVPPGPCIAERVGQAVAGRPVYVHLDCDVLEPGIVPTEYQSPGGLDLAELHDTMQILAANTIVGLEISEFEAASTDEETHAFASRLMEALQPLLAVC